MSKLAATADSHAFGDSLGGWPNGGIFDFPSELMLESTADPILSGLGGGTAAYRGNKSEQFQDDDPAYAGNYELKFNYPNSVLPTAQPMAVPGSVDLEAPRNIGGIIGTQKLIASNGPVTGAQTNANWSNSRDLGHIPNPNYDGPVGGGPDQGQKIAAAYYASQWDQFSAQANAEALIASL